MKTLVFWKGEQPSPMGAILTLLQVVALLLPVSLSRKCFLLLGEILFFSFRKKLDYVRRQWQLVFPGVSSSQIESNLRKVFRHLALSLLEVILIKYKKEKALYFLIEKVRGEEFLQRAFQEGKGVVLVSAHLGNWELLAAWLGYHNYPVEVVYRDLIPPLVNNFMKSCRSVYRTGWIQWNKINEVRKALRQGKAVAILVDQKGEGKGMNCPFMGITTLSPTIHARLARLFGCPVIPAFITRKDEKLKHEIIFLPPFFTSLSQDRKYDIFSAVVLCNQIIEVFIRQFPTQWLWFTRRWNIKNPSESKFEQRFSF